MAWITIERARTHCRVEPEYPSDQLQPYMEAAEDAAVRYLNRAVFPSAQELNTALDALPAMLKAAREVYDAAVAAAAAVADETEKQAMLCVAKVKLDNARASAPRILNGIILNPSILSAALLTLGHLYANREDSVIGASAVELPNGAKSLLRPYRLVMMP